jgi:hypothetical protein
MEKTRRFTEQVTTRSLRPSESLVLLLLLSTCQQQLTVIEDDERRPLLTSGPSLGPEVDAGTFDEGNAQEILITKEAEAQEWVDSSSLCCARDFERVTIGHFCQMVHRC